MLVILLLMVGVPAAAEQPATVAVAVAPFADEVGFHRDLAGWAAARLSILLSSKGLHVVPFPQVQSALRDAGRRSEDLISLAATEDLARRLQVDAVVTGRLVRADTEPGGTDDGPPLRIGPSESSVTFVFRLMLVATRRTVYDEATGYHLGGGPYALTRAAEEALEQFVSHLPAGTF